MKKVLLATTALAGASLIATAAQAQSVVSDNQDGAAPVVQSQPAYAVRIAGTVSFSMTWTNQDQGVEDSSMIEPFDSKLFNADLSVFGSATADNGLSYGFEVDVENGTGNIHLANQLGRLDLGSTKMAQDSLDVGGRSVMVGRGHFDGGGDKNVVGTISTVMPWLCNGTDSRNVIRYSTPNYGGLTVSMSYCDSTDNNMTDGDAGLEDVWSVGGQYTSSYGNYTTVVSAGYSAGNNTVGKGGASDIDSSSTVWSVGAKVTGMGAGFGLSYGEKHVSQNSTSSRDADLVWFDVGLSYASGPWSISAGGVWSSLDNPTSTPPSGATDQVAYSVSANYNLAPGLAIMGGVTIWDIDRNGATGLTDNSATTFTLATKASF